MRRARRASSLRSEAITRHPQPTANGGTRTSIAVDPRAAAAPLSQPSEHRRESYNPPHPDHRGARRAGGHDRDRSRRSCRRRTSFSGLHQYLHRHDQPCPHSDTRCGEDHDPRADRLDRMLRHDQGPARHRPWNPGICRASHRRDLPRARRHRQSAPDHPDDRRHQGHGRNALGPTDSPYRARHSAVPRRAIPRQRRHLPAARRLRVHASGAGQRNDDRHAAR